MKFRTVEGGFMHAKEFVIHSLIAVASCALSLNAVAQTQTESATSKTRIVLLGAGAPSPDPDRSGPASAIVVNGTPYLIDFGLASCVESQRHQRKV